MEKFAYYKFAFGILKVGYTQTDITVLQCAKEVVFKNEPSLLSDMAFQQVLEYLTGKRREFDLPICLIGTNFQKSVWDAICQIPYGHTQTYKEIATVLNKPKASRAVGTACGKNPIWLVIPCHRVIGTDGRISGYAGGIEMKNTLLALEKQNRSNIG